MTDHELLEKAVTNTQEILSILRTGRGLPFGEGAPARPAGSDPEATIDLEQPRYPMANAGEFRIHFGHCKDMTVAEADTKGRLDWFLTKWKPRPREIDGQLWDNDDRLWNAIRNYWHRKQGTLVGMYQEAKRPPPEVRDAVQPKSDAPDPDVPF
jgi:hypothetical protein